MALLVEIELSCPTVFLGPTLETLQDLEICLERQFALDPNRPISFCWIQYDRPDRFERLLALDHTVATFDRIEDNESRYLYRFQRNGSDVLGFYQCWVESGGELLSGVGANGRWTFRIRFPDRESFTQFRERLAEMDVDFDLERLADVDSSDGDVLTGPQREALKLALEAGYFDVPRRTTLRTLSDSLGISDQAVSERLRRGQARLLEDFLT